MGIRCRICRAVFVALATTPTCPLAAVRHRDAAVLWGAVSSGGDAHAARGRRLFENFLYEICKCAGDVDDGELCGADDRGGCGEQVGTGKVICGLSGGVDSSVVAALLHKAIGEQLTCIFVDNGLLRKNERELVERTFRDHFKINLRVADASGAVFDGACRA